MSVFWSMLVATGMIAQQLAGKAVRDAFFLTRFDAQMLPQAMTLAAATSVILVLLASQLYRRFGPARIAPHLFTSSALLFLVEWWMSSTDPKAAAMILYIHTSSFGALAISGFWSVVNEVFDPHTAKRVVGRIAGGASLGGVMGGLFAWQGADHLSLESMILVLAGTNTVCSIGSLRLARRVHTTHAAEAPAFSAVEVFEKTPYLRNVAGLVVLLAVASAGYDYAFKATASTVLGGSENLVQFFALFYSGLGIFTFVVQYLAVGRLLRSLGLTWAVGSLPASIIFFGLLAWQIPELWSFTLLRAVAAIFESSLYRSGYELLYTPLTLDKKRSTKTLIDVGGDKLGVAAGSAIAIFVVGLLPGASSSILVLMSVSCAMGALLLTRRLYRGYLAALTESLEKGALRPDDMNTWDRSSVRAVEQTMALQRTQGPESAWSIPVNIEVRERDGPACVVPWMLAAPSTTEASQIPAPWTPPAGLEELASKGNSGGHLVALAALNTRDLDAVSWVLRHHVPLPPRLVPSVIELLNDERHGAAAMKALRPVAAAHIGQLGDVVLDRRRPLAQRSAVPEILGSIADPRAVEVLWHATGSRPLEIRLRSAFALDSQVQIRTVSITRDAVFQRLLAELGRYPPASASPHRRRQVLAFSVRMLSVVLPREPFLLAVRAIAQADHRHSGTAREYLDNLLPGPLFDSLLVLLRHHSALAVVDAKTPDEVLSVEPPLDSLERVRERLTTWFHAI